MSEKSLMHSLIIFLNCCYRIFSTKYSNFEYKKPGGLKIAFFPARFKFLSCIIHRN